MSINIIGSNKIKNIDIIENTIIKSETTIVVNKIPNDTKNLYIKLKKSKFFIFYKNFNFYKFFERKPRS